MEIKGITRHSAVRVVFLLCLFGMVKVPADVPGIVETARNQDWVTLQTMLDGAGVENVNATAPDGATALAYAAYRDNVEAARALLEAGADPNAGNDYGVTPIMLAMENRSAAMVKTLLEAGSDPDTASWSGETLLMTAARTGFIEAIRMLLDHGANVNAQDPRRKQSALMWAISFGYPEAARLLVEDGADVNAKTIRLNEDFTPLVLEGYGNSIIHTVPMGGYTPLLFAARTGDMDTVRLLVEHGADVNILSETDGSPLLMAASQGYEELALFLLEQGADPNATDGNGMSALHYALRDGIKALHGLYTTSKDLVCNFGGESFLCRPHETLSKEQLAYINDPNSEVYIVKPKKFDRNKPLPGPNMLKLAAALLEKGADPNTPMIAPPAALRLERNPWFSMRNATPLFLAAASQDLNAVSILLEEAAEPLSSTKMPEDLFVAQVKMPAEDNMVVGSATTLMAAVGMGRRSDFTLEEEEAAIQIAKILISLGADVNAATESGWTPLHAAAFLGSDRLVSFLVEQGAKIDVMTGCGRTPISLAMADRTEGMLDRTLPRIETVELLLELGAGTSPPEGPVGQCIGGRGGLEADQAQNQLVREKIELVQQKLEQRKTGWARP